MKFVITDAGLRAAQEAKANGYQISLTSFAVGSAYNYAPTTADTKLHGEELHRGGISGYTVIDANTVEYTCIMDQNVGTFQYGEVGLYTEDGTLFALAAQPKVLEKTRGDATLSGNKIAIEAQLKLAQAEAIFQFELPQLQNAKLLEIPSVAHLKPPVISDSNAYLTLSRDINGMTVFAYRASDFEWSFPTFTRVGTFTVTDVGSGYTSAPTITLEGGAGSGATATATVKDGSVSSITLTNGGSGYTSAPTVKITGGGGVGASAIAHIDKGVSSITVNNVGRGYTSDPTITIDGGGGYGATAEAVIENEKIKEIRVTNTGRGYTGNPYVTITGGGGSAATATANVSGVVSEVELLGNSTTTLSCNNLNNSARNMKYGKYLLQFLTGALKGYVRFVTESTATSLKWAALEKVGSNPQVGDQFNLYMCSAEAIEDHKTDEHAHPQYETVVHARQTANEFNAALQKLKDISFTVNGDLNSSANNYLKQGLYRINSAQNTPENSGTLFVYETTHSDGNGNSPIPNNERKRVQQFFSDTGKSYTRYWLGGNWTDWSGSNKFLMVKESPVIVDYSNRVAFQDQAELWNTGVTNTGVFKFVSPPLGDKWLDITLDMRGSLNNRMGSFDASVTMFKANGVNGAVSIHTSYCDGNAPFCVFVEPNASNGRVTVYLANTDRSPVHQNNATVRLSCTLTGENGAYLVGAKGDQWDAYFVAGVPASAIKGFHASPFLYRGLLGNENIHLNTLYATGLMQYKEWDNNGNHMGGIYYQGYDTFANPALGYPIQRAGTLIVFPSAYRGYQIYQCYTGEQYQRHTTDAGGNWSAWKRTDNVGGVPIGTVIYFAGQTDRVPPGFLIANGAWLNRNQYGELFYAIGTTYGNGDGSTTFPIPDLRGLFIRSVDLGRGFDGGRSIGSFQDDAIRNITGSISLIGATVDGDSGALYRHGNSGGNGAYRRGLSDDFTFDASRVVPVAHENRPKNIALLALIKAYNP